MGFALDWFDGSHRRSVHLTLMDHRAGVWGARRANVMAVTAVVTPALIAPVCRARVVGDEEER
jgi:hypothetical protein